jgi:hypothetical protein
MNRPLGGADNAVEQAFGSLDISGLGGDVASIFDFVATSCPTDSLASTDLFLALALAMAFFTPCSAILTQSYGKSIRQFWLIFA